VLSVPLFLLAIVLSVPLFLLAIVLSVPLFLLAIVLSVPLRLTDDFVASNSYFKNLKNEFTFCLVFHDSWYEKNNGNRSPANNINFSLIQFVIHLSKWCIMFKYICWRLVQKNVAFIKLDIYKFISTYYITVSIYPHGVVCPSSIYRFWLFLWCLQTFLKG